MKARVLRAHVQFCAIRGPSGTVWMTTAGVSCLVKGGALGGTRTPNLLIRSQMLYPLSYERTNQQYTAGRVLTARAGGPCRRAQL
jgi:hypothetical protein